MTAPATTRPAKPPYRVPSMAEVAATPSNGYSTVSTFSGAGGSCLGFRMAGFQILYASEFISAARDTYLANWPHALVDPRDIREVTADDLLAKIGRQPGEVDVLEGSPPCAAFSTAGKREKTWGKVKNYSDGAQVTDDLFYEYARLLEGIQPRTFVAENVSGLVKGTAKGYFKLILARLRACGYRVQARLLDAQWLGVPQQRQRLIFIGVRNDLGLDPVFPEPLPYRYSVRDALPWLTGIQSQGHGFYEGGRRSAALPAPTVAASQGGAAYNGHEVEEVVAVSRNGGYGTEDWQSPELPAKTIGAGPQTGNGRAGAGEIQVRREVEPEADISRYAIGEEWERLKPGEQSDRYFSLQRAHPDQPSPTVTATGSTLSAAAVTHPTEKRKFTLAELRRICSFPDDFALTGSYAQGWERMGRAVPPLMMRAVAETVRDRILAVADGKAAG